MTNIGGHMKNSTVSIAEGKKSFSRLIQDVIKKKEEKQEYAASFNRIHFLCTV